jgi:hypothetical protein
MKCSGCGAELGPGFKYLVVYKRFAGFQIEVGCDHYTPDTKDAVAILGGADCALEWFLNWEESLKRCNHEAEHRN